MKRLFLTLLAALTFFGEPLSAQVVTSTARPRTANGLPRPVEFQIEIDKDTTNPLITTRPYNADGQPVDPKFVVNLDQSGNVVTATSYTAPVTSALKRSVTSRLSDFITMRDFGVEVSNSAMLNGQLVVIAQNSAAVGGFKPYLPYGTYATDITVNSILGPLQGEGKITALGGETIPGEFTWVRSHPTEGASDYMYTAFSGNTSQTKIYAHRVSGVATLTQPTSGYKIVNEASGHYEQMLTDPEIGYNNSTSTNDGRTGIAMNELLVTHRGNGDGYGYHTTVFVNGVKPGLTDVLAGSAGVIHGGGVTAGANDVLLNNIEMNSYDNGYRASAATFVANLYRTNVDTTNGQFWAAFSAQTQGAAYADDAFRVAGRFNVGLDMTTLISEPTNKTAIAIKPNDRVYFNAAQRATGTVRILGNPGTEYIDYNSSSARLETVVGGNTRFGVSATGTASTGGQIIALRVVTAAGAVTVATTDYVVAINKTVGAATVVNLPASPATGQTFIIKDKKGDAASNNITITPAAGTIDGSGTFVMSSNRQTVTVTYDGSEWIIIAQ